VQEPRRDPGYSGGRRLAEDELATWRAFLRAHATVTRRLERELAQAGGLTLSELDVLIALQGADAGSLRLGELADRVLLTRSGLTRLVDRLEAAGLVERLACSSDRRGQNAVLTLAGRDALRRTIGTHLRGVAAAFADRVGDDERTAFRATLERIAAQR
jgi:DNA-binding MarR family transcriptional regulator